jgi:hypothetical protein
MPFVDDETWKKRIEAARRRRDALLTVWSQYARLHTGAYRVLQDVNEDALIALPSGRQVKVNAVYRQLEQTFALLDVPEVVVSAQALDFARELGPVDTHREAVVGTALTNSIHTSGLIAHSEEADAVKRDGVMIGHGVCYTWWRVVEEERPGEPVPLLVEGADGTLAPILDEQTGEPQFEAEATEEVVWEGVQDSHVPVTEFLFDAAARSMRSSPWHGWERIVPLAELRADPRYAGRIPDDVVGTAYRRQDLYGVEQPPEDVVEQDSVKVIHIYDKINRECVEFLEAARGPGTGERIEAQVTDERSDLYRLAAAPYAVRFSHPDDSPFSIYVPIPANDSPWGISQVEHIKDVAVELDKLRTRALNLTRQLKIILLFQKGRLDEDQLRAALRADDAEPVGVDKQPEDKWESLIKQIEPARIPPDIYTQIQQAEADVRRIEGISEEALGGSTETATESENNMAIGGARIRRKRRLYMDFLVEAANRHLDFLRTFAPPATPAVVTTPDGQQLFLEYGREAFRGRFRLLVLAGGDAQVVSPVEQKMLVELSNLILGRFSPVADRIWMRQLLTRLRIRDVNALLGALPQGWAVPGVGGPGAAPGVDGRARADAFLPNDQSNPQAIRAAVNALSEG